MTTQSPPPETLDTGLWSQSHARPVFEAVGHRHALHSYFNRCPESPDGRWVLLFASRQDDAHVGDVVMVERQTGEAVTLAADVAVEDAHRQAYQQWIAGGRYVVFLNLAAGRWQVERVEVRTLQRQVIARDRLMAWSQPMADVAMLYPPHWQVTDNPDIEYLDIHTGQVSKAVRAGDAIPALEPMIARLLPDADRGKLSLFFPVLSPDQSRVMFKLALPTGEGFQSSHASARIGLAVWDLNANRLVAWTQNWGHPAWHPDSRRIVNVPSQMLDGQTLSPTTIAGHPIFSGSHPSISPDGGWFVTDTMLQHHGGQKEQWGIIVADMQTGRWRMAFRGQTVGHGTSSWRKPHPHPAFNAQSNRIYFNVNVDGRLTLHVLEATGQG